jgi:DegV family protein with EDD domain
MVKENDTLPKTSMPNLKLVKRLFEQLIEHHEEVIYISLASALSGTHQAIKNLAGEISEHIHVIDSKKNSGAQGLVVLEVAKMIGDNLSVEKIKEELPQIIKNTEIYVAVDNFKYMVLGGRVPKTIGKVGSFLNLRPIVSLDEQGKGTAFGGSFSRRGAINKIYKILEEASQENDIRNVAITYSNESLDAEVLAHKIENELSIKVDYIKDISNVVAISAGENALAISFTKEVV